MGGFLEDFSGEFGKGIITMVWNDEGMSEALNNGARRIQGKLESVLEFMAPQVENWMKDNASWTDQTGNARNGLAARAFKERDAQGIVVYHQVPYGIWLEVRFSGRYAIIIPALEEWGPRVMERVRGIMEEI